VVTTRRVRHGHVLTLVGLLAGLGIVAALYGGGGPKRTDEPAAQNPAAALSPDRPAGSGPDGAPATAQEGARKDPDLDSGNRQAARNGAGATGGGGEPGGGRPPAVLTMQLSFLRQQYRQKYQRAPAEPAR